ncbi:DNA (cytosine-5-)-methyltransferase [Dehalobacter restrictus]|uniref:DNA (cytosine-5-)-methyltransferase n=1 Tax=Dehalobacter restrictus TaxID=55583 RepID=UPI00338EFB6C
MIRFFDMFSGIGGFRAGLEKAGGFKCVGHCEIDKHADAAYRVLHNVKESEIYYTDATTIDTDTLPEFDLLCAGFPCQSFSIAGKRKGFSDPRGTMFFEIARVARARRPAYLLLENVPGLLSHDKGRTYAAILHTLCDLGYSCEWQVLNSKNFGVPQSRRRVYIIGYLDRKCAGKILPVRETNAKTLIQLLGGRQDSRVYDPEGLSKTLLAKSGGLGGKTGLYAVGYNRRDKITGKIDTAYALNDSNFRGLNRNQTQNTVFEDASMEPTLHGRIRRLVPRECLRLQGFLDEQIDRLLSVNSDTQAYKQAGNAVTVNVVYELGLRLKTAHRASQGAVCAKKGAAL